MIYNLESILKRGVIGIGVSDLFHLYPIPVFFERGGIDG